MANLMPNLLKNPNPATGLEPGARCYLAVNNASGGMTLPATITKPDFLENGTGVYVVACRDRVPPYAVWEETILISEAFITLDSIAMARRDDESLQIRNAMEACATPEGLVRYLLSYTCLKGTSYDVALEAARKLKLYNDKERS